MQLVHTAADLRTALTGSRRTAFVPTMGNLHAGHVSLVELAKRHGDPVVASIFVNPLQFGPAEDFERYPRTLSSDCERLEAAGCDVAFAPGVGEMYAVPQTVLVQPPSALAETLCGVFRPGHFAGVATVVLKLFNLVQPHVAVFGKKDFQQLRVIREMVRQLNLSIEIVAGDTLRESDGLAMSSRNHYPTPAERAQAAALPRELAGIRDALRGGAPDHAVLCDAAAARLTAAGWRVDYVTLRDAETLQPPDAASRHGVVLGAAWLGRTRLIDNVELALAPAS